MNINRWFVRCRLCLTVAAIDAVSLPKGTLACAACDGPIEIMGRVDGCTSHLETRCKCDARCTNAKGPNCDCSCGGVNHGKGMLVTIADLSKVMIAPTEKALAVAKEFREALIPVNRAIRLLQEKKQAGKYLQPTEFARLCHLERLRVKARNAKTHAARMKLLKEFRKGE